MAEDDDSGIPVGARTMQVDAVADALDVLDEQGAGGGDVSPPVLPPPLPSRKKRVPIVAMVVAAVVAIGAAVLVGTLMSPPAPAAGTAPGEEPEAEGAGTQIDLGPIMVQASEGANDPDAGDAASEESASDAASP